MDNSATITDEYLGQRSFFITIGGVFLLHVALLYVWYLMPKSHVVEIPVRALNIKLGSIDAISEEEIKALQPKNANAVENAVPRTAQASAEQPRKDTANSADKAIAPLAPLKPPVVTKQPVSHAPTMPAPSPSQAKVKGKFDVRQEGTSVAAPVMPVDAHQYVRELPAPVAPKPQPVQGNSSASNAEMISRYGQTISLWIEKFKQYPTELRAQKIEGETVIRIRIDRHGNIGYYILEHSTGSAILDQAAIDMVKRANPVPAVPNDYPPGDQMEFLVPVNFHLK